MWDWFINFLYQILAFLAGFVGDWGLAIIVLTYYPPHSYPSYFAFYEVFCSYASTSAKDERASRALRG